MQDSSADETVLYLGTWAASPLVQACDIHQTLSDSLIRTLLESGCKHLSNHSNKNALPASRYNTVF